MPYPIAMIPYINMAPYRASGAPAGCVFVDVTPRDSVARLLTGEVIAACAPVGALPELFAQVDYLGDEAQASYGIAATGETGSVLCFSRRPFAELHQDASLYLTGDSASSVRLLFLLLGQRVGFENLPRRVSDAAQADAVLLIGDAAIRAAGEGAWAYVTDLAAEWHRQHQLPFVFARWVIRKDAPAETRAALTAWLADYAAGESAYTEIAIHELSFSGAASAEFLRAYFAQVRRVLTADDLLGQALFLSEIERHKREPLFSCFVKIAK